ncbi:hypothetical protein OS493_040365, partial [Desmophyllum pertusum]
PSDTTDHTKLDQQVIACCDSHTAPLVILGNLMLLCSETKEKFRILSQNFVDEEVCGMFGDFF